MSIVGSSAMGTPFFLHELKKQASFFLKEKIRTARLALTDVTPAQLLAEEATEGNPWPPDAITMRRLSRAAFEIDDYWRIVEILHKRFEKFDLKNWREAYNALVLLEHLLTHGPESVAAEFQSDREVILKLGDFQYVDEKGFNWGITVGNKTERVQKLLEKGPLLKEERDRARRISRGIQGFGSFNLSRSSSTDVGEDRSHIYGKSTSLSEDYRHRKEPNSGSEKEDLNSGDGFAAPKNNSAETKMRFLKEKLGSKSSAIEVEVAAKPLLACEEVRKNELLREDHPFSNFQHSNMDSMLLLSQS